MHTHFILSTAPTKDEPTREEGMRHAKESIEFARERIDFKDYIVYAPNFFSSDGFSERTLGSISRSPFGEHEKTAADAVDSIKSLDEFVRENLFLNADEILLAGLTEADKFRSLIKSGGKIDFVKLKKSGFWAANLAKIAQSTLSMSERMSQYERLGGKVDKWSVSKGDMFFDEDLSQSGVSWLNSNALTDVLDERKDRRLWVTRLVVHPI